MIRLWSPPARQKLTGGHLYNDRIARELAGNPAFEASEVAPGELNARLAALGARDLVVVDSLLVPSLRPVPGGPRVAGLLHSFPESMEPGLAACSGFIVPSRTMAAALEARPGGHGKPVFVARPGVDALFRPAARRPSRLAGPARIVTIAHFEPRKGHLDALAALAGLKHLDWSWDLVGDPESDPRAHEELASRIRESGLARRIRFLGTLTPSEVGRLLRRSDLMLLPSAMESYGMVFAEAAASGVPSVAFAAGAVPEVVEHGRTGLLCPPGDRDGLREAIATLISDRARLRELRAFCIGRERGRQSWSATARAFLDASLALYSGGAPTCAPERAATLH